MDESFLPYAMLEPLLEPGMTATQFTRKLRKHLGLPPHLYGAITQVPGGATGMDYREALKWGLRIVKRNSPEWHAAFPADGPR